MSLEEISSLREELETDDVGQKRYIMYRIFDLLLEEVYRINDEESPELTERVNKLNGIDGYIYKLSQEFLNSSSTLEKENKLDDMIERVERLR